MYAEKRLVLLNKEASHLSVHLVTVLKFILKVGSLFNFFPIGTENLLGTREAQRLIEIVVHQHRLAVYEEYHQEGYW